MKILPHKPIMDFYVTKCYITRPQDKNDFLEVSVHHNRILDEIMKFRRVWQQEKCIIWINGYSYLIELISTSNGEILLNQKAIRYVNDRKYKILNKRRVKLDIVPFDLLSV